MEYHIALVEDEMAIAQNYRDAFTRLGYRVKIYNCRQSAMKAFNTRLPDMVIIDVGLGNEYEGGFELCRELRSIAPTLPLLFLTARDSELDEVSGLRLGADDYLTKDISINQMLARVNALFRRVEAMKQGSKTQEKVLKQGHLCINSDRFTISWLEQAVELTLTEFWIIHALARHPGQVKSREQLMQAANVVQDDNTITTHIKRIRRKFQDIDANFDHIRTAYGLGYRWQASSES